MSLEANTLVKIIKQAAVEAMEAQKPVSTVIGSVISTYPLKVKIGQKITLTERQLLLLSTVKGDNALGVNEKVLMLRCSGGQQYIILDRTE